MEFEKVMESISGKSENKLHHLFHKGIYESGEAFCPIFH